jgi:hypothetical protein
MPKRVACRPTIDLGTFRLGEYALFNPLKLQIISKLIHSRVQWILILIAMYITAILYGLDTTVVADVQGTIIERFGESEKLAWIGVGFPLGSIAVILSL